MRKLINMDEKSEIGFVDWEFIHDMQGLVPEYINPELISLNKDFLGQIPSKWTELKQKLAKHLRGKEMVHVAIADVENLGNDFKIRGTLQDKEGNHLSYYKVVVFDEDKFEDDYLGAVITNEQGMFELSFGKKTFSDFGLEAEPDIYLKIFLWQEGRFFEMSRIVPEVFEKTEFNGDKVLIEFGTIIL